MGFPELAEDDLCLVVQAVVVQVLNVVGILPLDAQGVTHPHPHAVLGCVTTRYSSFNYVALLHSLLAKVPVHWSWEWGTMVGIVQRQPPCFIVFSRSTSMFVVVCAYFHMAKLLASSLSLRSWVRTTPLPPKHPRF